MSISADDRTAIVRALLAAMEKSRQFLPVYGGDPKINDVRNGFEQGWRGGVCEAMHQIADHMLPPSLREEFLKACKVDG